MLLSDTYTTIYDIVSPISVHCGVMTQAVSNQEAIGPLFFGETTWRGEEGTDWDGMMVLDQAGDFS